MVGGVVCNQHGLVATAAAVTQQEREKGLKRLGVERGDEHGDEFPAADVHAAKERNGFARGRVSHNRIPFLRGNPHYASASVLLEVAFIQRPEVNVRVACHPSEFFYILPAVRGQHGQSGAVASAAETPSCETSVGIAARPALLRNEP